LTKSTFDQITHWQNQQFTQSRLDQITDWPNKHLTPNSI
jgi:hypothetical protein